MFLKSFKYFLIISVFLSSAAYGETLSLSQALENALQKNPDIISARKAFESVEARVPAALSLPDPSLGVEYEQVPLASGNWEDGMKMYTVSQMVMFPGKTFAEYDMVRAQSQMLLSRYQAKVLAVQSEVKSTYYNLYLTDRTVSIFEEVSDYLLKIKKIAEAKYMVGQTMQSDVLQAGIEYLMLDNELATLAQERGMREIQLETLLGLSDPAALEIESDLTIPQTLETAAVLEETALKNRPELKEMAAELSMKGAAEQKARMDFFPDMMLGYKRRTAGSYDTMLSFSIPLYFWKQNYSLAASRLEKESSEADLSNMLNMTRFEVRELWVDAESSLRTARLYQESILPQSLQAFKVGLAAYQSGKADFANLLQLARTYKEARLKYYENQVMAGKALAKLNRLIGKEMM
jgi:outer membrane protein TolC